MQNCPLQLNADNLWQCPNCGWVYPRKSDKPPHRNCPASRTPEAIAAAEAERERQQAEALEAGTKLGWKPKHIKRWAGALLKWKRAGYPTRTDTKVAAILVICESCDKYKADEGRCSVCGCCVSTSGMAVFNKTRMATECCPKGKW